MCSYEELSIAIGKKIKFKRNILKLNQTQLAKKLGVSFQQIQKYENGSNKISAVRLYEISKILLIPIEDFFIDFKGSNNSFSGINSQVNQNESLELLNMFYKIDKEKRKVLMEFIASFKG